MKLYKDNAKTSIMNIKAVIYDFDGTLADSFPAIYQYWQGLCKENNKPFPFRDELHARDVHSKMHNFTDFFKHLGFDWNSDKIIIQECYNKIIGQANIPLFTGIDQVINSVADRKILQGVATDGTYEKTHIWFDRFPEFKSKFDAIITLSEQIPPKPNPTMLKKAAKELKVACKHCIYVGDTARDMITARKAGMFPIGVSYGKFEDADLLKPHTAFIAKTPLELVELIDSLMDD